jgi:uncharacterized membrane protein
LVRAVIVDHDNDPIAQMLVRSAAKRPVWLSESDRGRNVLEGMQRSPVITFVQVLGAQ